MANGNGSNLLSENVDPKTWKGYVVKTLEDLDKGIKNLQENSIDKESFNKLVENVNKVMECLHDCNIKEIEVVIYGDKEAKTEGLISKLSKLELSHKIKSGYYGVLGGGGMTAILALVYHLLNSSK